MGGKPGSTFDTNPPKLDLDHFQDYQVIDKIGFLKCPGDLKPGDVGRVAGILAK
jgi:hypothetical protein